MNKDFVITIYDVICSPRTTLCHIPVSPEDKSACNSSPCNLKNQLNMTGTAADSGKQAILHVVLASLNNFGTRPDVHMLVSLLGLPS